MAIKSPSNNMKLADLIAVKENNYIGKNNVEYSSYEVDYLILKKQIKIAELEVRAEETRKRNGYKAYANSARGRLHLLRQQIEQHQKRIMKEDNDVPF